MTILFADLVGFTTLVREDAGRERWPGMLTEFFTLASDAVFACGGTIDKFIGDAVMAFFGAPLDQPDHADRAVAAALKIRDGDRPSGTGSATARGEPPLEVRIAVNTGEAIVGDIGSERRVDYTVLGNAVNVAARLEEFVAQPGDVVIGPDDVRGGAGPLRVRAARLLRAEGALDAGAALQGPEQAVRRSCQSSVVSRQFSVVSCRF